MPGARAATVSTAALLWALCSTTADAASAMGGPRPRQTLLAFRERAQPVAAALACGESFAVSDDAQVGCPASCPLAKTDLDHFCRVRCITEADCLSSNTNVVGWANHAAGFCESCLVIGCIACGVSSTSCSVCAPGYELHANECLETLRWSWYVLYAVLILIVLLVIGWFVRLVMAEVGNQLGLEQAQENRSLAKVRSDTDGHHLYPLGTDLCTEDVSGLAVVLHFRWQRFFLVWAFCILLATAFLSALWHRQHHKAALDEIPGSVGAMNGCLKLHRQEQAALEATRHLFVWVTGAAWILTTGFSFWFGLRQRDFYAQTAIDTAGMGDVACLATGFPHDIGSKELEVEYMDFFQEALGHEAVVGVSICWDILDDSDQLNEVVLDEVSELDDARDAQCPARDAENAGAPSPNLWGDTKVGKEGTIQLLHGLRTTEYAIVVLRSEAHLARTMKIQPPMLQKFRGTHDITLGLMDSAPAAVLWDGWSITRKERIIRILLGIAAMIGIIVLWALLFYGPVILYARAYMNVAGQREGSPVAALLVGSLVTVGNAVVYQTASLIADKARFCNKDSREKFNLLLYTVAIFANSVIDLYIYVYAVSEGYLEDAMHGVGSHAVTHNPNMQDVMYSTLFAYLVPGCILAPFIAEILIYIIPLILGSLLIRTSKDMSRPNSEAMLMPQPFDMTRCGDIINNILLVILCFFLTNVNLWRIFLWLVLGHGYIYLWDSYRVLRFSVHAEFNSDTVQKTVQHLTVLPSAFLAGAFVFKVWGGQAMVAEWDRTEFLSFNPVWISVASAIILHLVLHVLAIDYVLPRLAKKIEEREDQEELYQELSANIACSWFNSNPVHCLRSRHMYKHSPPFVQYLPGKEYLQLKNDAIGAYYESFVYDREGDVFDDAKLLLKQGSLKAKKMKDETVSAAAKTVSAAAAAGSHVKHSASRLGSHLPKVHLPHWHRSASADPAAPSEGSFSEGATTPGRGSTSGREPSPQAPEDAGQGADEEAPAAAVPPPSSGLASAEGSDQEASTGPQPRPS